MPYLRLATTQVITHGASVLQCIRAGEHGRSVRGAPRHGVGRQVVRELMAGGGEVSHSGSWSQGGKAAGSMDGQLQSC
jgi:hypothetical protein